MSTTNLHAGEATLTRQKLDKNQILRDLARLIAEHQDDIIQQNQLDLERAGDLDPTLVDRLKVNEKKVAGMVAAVENVIRLDDPQGRVLSRYPHPNGMVVENRVVPFGTILIIYESRPDVTIEAAISAFKAGNKILLKGGKEAKQSNLYLVQLWHEALTKNGADPSYVQYLDFNREQTQRLIADNTHRVDLIIPRGGEGLINYIRNNTSIPLLVSGRGNNFVYVHDDADFAMAIDLILNGKQRLSVCNAIDKVLLNKHLPQREAKLRQLIQRLQDIGMTTIYGDESLRADFPQLVPIDSPDLYAEEFLAPKILLGEVASVEEAIQLVNDHSGGHSAVIVTADADVAALYQEEVDCAAVYHNASSRFTDGGEFGFGAEIAISTQKLHFRGPIGLAQLVTNKWFISGNGQTRA
ncbi:glutamate-5-semialdehyde dehydrogenase [Catalinimonas alkaloidigena]|uniref:Gamma-glutamyl phosphate reductase n=1 Tax=Catalinimonas alkaloidigena TaxID=1075417 RepID=A0A1G9A9S2_9BACT|nr:glutamate-5-semialdehyde dehydrogenase [Catalinimonas alkaloidigena]SDK23355.1 glutamate-5-semialdehyde dehydrogenase [Catalinimonas alkaloidigena]